MSKGSSRRPAQVSEAHVRAEYERIFAKKPSKEAFIAWAEATFPEHHKRMAEWRQLIDESATDG